MKWRNIKNYFITQTQKKEPLIYVSYTHDATDGRENLSTRITPIKFVRR